MVSTDVEDNDKTLIKNAVNEGYMYLAANVDTNVKSASLTATSNRINIPNDCYETIEIYNTTYGRLSSLDFIEIGNAIFIKNKDITDNSYTLTYISIPDKLVNDTDVLVLKDMYCYILSAYTTYVYQLSKKKLDVAQLLIGEFSKYIPVRSGGGNSDSQGNS